MFVKLYAPSPIQLTVHTQRCGISALVAYGFATCPISEIPPTIASTLSTVTTRRITSLAFIGSGPLSLISSNGDDRLFAFSHELFAHANEHRAVFRAMTGKRSGAVIQQLLHKMLVDFVHDEVKLMFPSSAARETPLEAISQFIGGGLVGLLIWRGSGMMRMPVDEVDAVFRRLAIPAARAATG